MFETCILTKHCCLDCLKLIPNVAEQPASLSLVYHIEINPLINPVALFLLSFLLFKGRHYFTMLLSMYVRTFSDIAMVCDMFCYIFLCLSWGIRANHFDAPAFPHCCCCWMWWKLEPLSEDLYSISVVCERPAMRVYEENVAGSGWWTSNIWLITSSNIWLITSTVMEGSVRLVNYYNSWTMSECRLMVLAVKNEVLIFLDSPSSFLDS